VQLRQVVIECPVEQGADGGRVGELGLGERPQRQRLHPPRQRVGEPGRTERPRRSGEQETPGPPGAIDLGLDRQQQLGKALSLVDADQPCSPADEPDGIGPRGIEDAGVVERQPPPVRPRHHMFGQGALARLTRTGHDHHRRIGQRLLERAGQQPWSVHDHTLPRESAIRGRHTCNSR
jgi:hypothetical protein